MNDLHFDAELESLIPPLSEEENRALEQLLCKHGCQQPLVAWKSTVGPILIDGHHRYAIFTNHDIPYTVTEMTFKGRDDVKLWMIRNQLGRRNLSVYQRALLAMKLKPDGAADNSTELAALCGLSRSTLYRVRVIQAEADDELKALLAAGGTTIGAAFARVRPEAPPETSQTRPAPTPPEKKAIAATAPAREVKSVAPRGKTMLNNKLVDDPDDIHEMRMRGVMPANHVPILTIEEDDPEDDMEIEEQTEEEWLESLYARQYLSEVAREGFDKSATLYRLLRDSTTSFKAEMRQAIKSVGLPSSHLPTPAYRLWSAINMEPPESWTPCPPMDKGGCNGTGEIVGLGQCKKCHGCGFLVP